MKNITPIISIFILLISLTFTVKAQQALDLQGVNLAGAEFNHGTFWPTQQEFTYFKNKGMNTFRIPFLWERLQPNLGQGFDSTQQTSLISAVNMATNQGGYAIIDPHNYARYQGQLIGSASVSNADFADLWTRLANLFIDNSRVIFGLMNEPNSMPTEQWKDSANAAIAAIRQTGAEQLILVPGNAWTGAHSWTQSWYGTSNSTVMLSIVDPLDYYAFDLHQYFDGDFSGTSPSCSNGHGSAQLLEVTAWLRAQGKMGLLGEFAGGNNAQCQQSVSQALQYMSDNNDVWLGWTWWAAGPEWGEYIFTLEPSNNFSDDRPQMAWLTPFLAAADDVIFIDSFD